jgi:hypothetical protein
MNFGRQACVSSAKNPFSRVGGESLFTTSQARISPTLGVWSTSNDQGHHLMEDFVQHTRANKETSNERKIISNVESKNMKGFEALRMSDGNYFPIPQMVGGFHYPVVFNNACSSWRSQSLEFGCNGASVYVGTATDVLNPVAVVVASSFVKAVTSGKSVGIALFRSQKSFTEQFGYTPYLMHGYLYTNLANPPSRSSNPRVVERLISAIEAAKRLPNSNKHTAAVNFLEQELLGFASSADFA